MARDLLPYPGLSAEVQRALAALEAGERGADLTEAYRIVKAEADRRAPLTAMLLVPTALLGAAVIWGVQTLGWLPRSAPWAYAFGPILFTALVMWPLRGQAARDDTRIGRALVTWRRRADAR